MNKASAATIIATAARLHGVTVKEVTGLGRERHVVRARDSAAWMLRKHRGMSYPEIARELGRESHSAAIDAVRRVEMTIERPQVYGQTG